MRRRVEDQRGKRTGASDLVVQYLVCRCLEAVVAAVSIQAEIISKAVGMVAEAKLIVSGFVIGIAGHQFALPASLKAAASDNIEHAIGPIAEFCRVASTLDLDIIDVLWVELRTDIAGDIRIRHRHAVNRPGDLMPASYMELIMNHVCPRDEVRDHGHTVGPV